MAWTRFWDMHSGGSQKEKAAKIYIEAPKGDAIRIFEKMFGHDPFNVTCDCCGKDYTVDEYKDLAQASGYFRNCAWQYVNSKGNPVLKSEWHQLPTEDKGEGYFVERPNEYGRYQTVEEYIKNPDVMVIRADEVVK